MSTPTQHAMLGASSAHRWLACPPSARLEAGMPDEGSQFAAQGTEAHALAELELSRRLGKISQQQHAARMRARKRSPWHDVEMEEAVGRYVDAVMAIVDDARDDAGGRDPFADLEQRVDFSRWVPGGFGTADVVVIADNRIHVVDLKYGKGVPVEAEGNPQLRLYALGAVEKYAPLASFDRVAMTIVQPRLQSQTTDEMTIDDLLAWADDVVVPAARLASEGAGEFAPSGETCRWCRARAVCRARAEAALATARVDFDDGMTGDSLPRADTLSDDDIARILPLLGEVQAWARDLQDHALALALGGDRIPGYKLVEGRSTRTINDPERAMELLDAAGVAADDYLKPYQLRGITDLTRLLGRKRFDAILGDLVVKPAGKPVLVPEDDKRPEIGGAESAGRDFA